jgi:hypothetical protein
MTREEKLRKAAVIAVAYYVEQERNTAMMATDSNAKTKWNQAGRTFQLNMKRMLQQRRSITQLV